MLKAVELFAGAGGLGMGIALAGFEALAVVEWDRWACDTIRENGQRGYPLVKGWPLFAGDVRSFDLGTLPVGIDLVAGGPPCQPFSMGGKHRAHDDDRDMFPTMVDVVRRLQPRAFIVENVKGLTRPTFANYFQYILLQFEFPEVARKRDEEWADHLKRLQRQKTSGRRTGLSYNVVATLANAANFGVPQRRERVFIVGFREDQDVKWSFPKETHSADALMVDQWVTQDYWERHRIGRKARPPMPPSLAGRIEEQRQLNLRANVVRAPWVTVRDAIQGLPDPERLRGEARYHNHRYQSGARSYPGHTGSPLDLPAKTLKSGVHGVPGGENMMVRDDGTVRYFTAREAARLQTFPDGYVFHGAWSEIMRQLGNAVPVALARIVAASVAEKLLQADMLRQVRAAGRA
ncbi:DNA cytosine methyltransferase [Bradyrhizobium sp. MOS002]|uniref:DNA cytosine methyltransferase n=1 Tax=Bradyrhizobium sp. MOS002 TaxID=2133947 RepID=UPI000D121441|nr:DNA cytosine methyltransferase [Bradyrhizobium sp. MOS002]PSO30906.1 DNA (cytosine-5-)-methyltransferase [Bradyrhizobium sp. MOS002]